PEAQRHEVEETLTGYAAQETPDFLHRVGTRILNHLDPDGQQPTDGALLAKQGIFFHQPRHGLIRFGGHMTLTQYETLMITIGWATNPKNHTTPTTTDGTDNTTKPENNSHPRRTENTSRPGRTDSIGGNGNGNGPDATASGTGATRAGTRHGKEPDTAGDIPGQGNLLDQLTTIADLVTPPTKTLPAPPPTMPPRPESVPPERPRDQPLPAMPTPGPAREPVPADAGVAGATAPSTLDGRGSGLSPWLHHATDPTGIGWYNHPDTRTGQTEDLSWLWGQPTPVTPIGWDPPPETNHTDPTTTTNTGTTTSMGVSDADTPAGHTDNRAAATGSTSGTNGTTTPVATTAGSGIDSGGAGWSRVIDGVRIPAPGSGAGLDGLDPIDPASTDPAVTDRRTHAQRLLDGLITCLTLAAGTKKLPINGGLKTQLIITTTEHELNQHRAGKPATAHTPHNGPVPLTLFDHACCDAEITHHYLDTTNTILNIGRTQRLFTPAQRKILIARDLGCTFPDCTAPAYWCEAHHITPWHHGGETSITNAALLCSHHHHLIHRTDWKITLLHGTPHYTPPYTLDPTTTPRHNTYHHGLPKNP
ncbi:HNH endonuclease signature motif containing protein, partial [Arthrobacter sp. GMC3]|uniref:HNH endonuclease signature motif containing protein n=1 Tax=Arthrobacter sp. GMC3 TaxID=2058894 RepID=UPI0011B0C4FB